MPEIITKIINEDGTERSFGPVTVSEAIADGVTELLTTAEEERQEAVNASRVAEIEEEQERRSKEAEEANQRRIELAEQGEEID